MNASPRSTTVHRFICNRKTQIAAVLFSVILGFLCYAVYSQHLKEQRYVSRFTASFNSGVTRLCSQPEISLSSPFPIPDIGPLKKLPQVTRFTITAQYIEGGVKHWGRWFYTCNSRHGDGIFMFSHSTAARRDDLPVSPGPTHVYIEFAVDLIDGIPTTAGASVSGLKIPSPVKVSDPLVITGFAPANSQCRVVVFLPKKVVSLPPPRQPELDGTVKWELTLTPEAAGSRLSIHVHCVEIRGTKFLENVTRGSADINP